MQSSLSSNQEILAVASDVSSPAILLERGMRCIQQGYLVEGKRCIIPARSLWRWVTGCR